MTCRPSVCRSLSTVFLIVLLTSLLGCSDESSDAIPTPELATSYTMLRASPYFATACYGTDGYYFQQTVAFRRILADPLADAHFKKLLDSDETSGRLYGLAGLFFTDSTFLAAVIPPYLESPDTVQVPSGGNLFPAKVSEIAEGIRTGAIPQALRGESCPTLIAEGTETLYHTCTCTRSAVRIMMGMDGPLVPGAETNPSSFEAPATIDRNLFEEPVFTADSELGKTRSATPLTDPDFLKVTGLLTNGKEDPVFIRIQDVPGGGGGGSGAYEKMLFNLDTTDFAGTDIVRIDMIVDDLRFISPGIAGGTDVFVQATFRIWGPSKGGAK